MMETAPSVREGILPEAKSGAHGLSGWSLPGHGEAYDDCGKKRYRGCLNVSEHPGGLDREPGLAYVQVYPRRCFRAVCPKCYESWAGREAGRAEHRLQGYRPRTARGVIHLSVSVPSKDWSLPYGRLRPRAYEVARAAGFKGGCSIFHPWREDEETGVWSLGPHFHMLGFGWIAGAEKVHEATEWVVKNLGLRKSVSATLLYQLSHAGIHGDFHTVTWFGALAYGKLKVEAMEPEKPTCPLCKAELTPLLWMAELGDPPGDVGCYFLERGGWVQRSLRSPFQPSI